MRRCNCPFRRIASEAKDMVKQLDAMQTGTVLLTGDHQTTADYFCKPRWNIRGSCRIASEEKVQNIEALQKENHKVV